MTTDILPEGFDFTDPDLNWKAIPHEQFALLRKTAPVFWVEQEPEARSGIAPEAGTGYWAVTKHADVAAVSAILVFFVGVGLMWARWRTGPGRPGIYANAAA